MSKKIFWFVIIIALCLIVVTFITNTEKQTPVSINYENQPFIGDESASVSIVEFGDYKCIHCSEFNKTVVPFITENFVNTGIAKFYFINYAFLSNESTDAALFAETVYHELGNDLFWAFHDIMFEKQNHSLDQQYLISILEQVASEAQVEQVKLASNNAHDALELDMNIAKDAKVNSTPTIFINGIKFNGETIEDFSKQIEEAKHGQ